jgi:hypothetical protein
MSTRDSNVDETYRGGSSKSGLGPDSAGQSGDTQGLTDMEDAGSESVMELVEEGQFFEAEAVSGIENAPDADVSEVYAHEELMDDVGSEDTQPEGDADPESPNAD